MTHPSALAYVVGAGVVLLSAYFVNLCILWCARKAFWLFTPMRRLVRWCWRKVSRRKKRRPELCKSRACDARRHFWSAAYCVAHEVSRADRRDSINSRAFDGRKFTYAERYYSKRDAEKALTVAVGKFNEGKPREDGFLYIYVSQFDLEQRHVALGDVTQDETFFYKIGMTTRSPYQRVREQPGAVFPSGATRGVAGKDWVPVRWALTAESLVHGALAGVRYRRFDAEESSFEQEWFLTDYETARRVLIKAREFMKRDPPVSVTQWQEMN